MKPFKGNHPVTFSYLRLYSSGKPHKGRDYGTPFRTPLFAPISGTVYYAGFAGAGSWGPSYGGQVIIEFTMPDGKKRWTILAHMNRIDVKRGQKVVMGLTQLGLSGGAPGTKGAGTSTGSHVHVQVNASTLWSNHINPEWMLAYTGPGAPTTKPTIIELPLRHSWEVTAKVLNGRSFPSTKYGSEVKATRSAGNVLESVGQAKVDGQWWVRGIDGLWYAMDYLLATVPTADRFKLPVTYVANVNVNLREYASTKARTMPPGLVKGQEFVALGSTASPDGGPAWLMNAKHQFVRSDLMKPKPIAPVKPAPRTAEIRMLFLPMAGYNSPDKRGITHALENTRGLAGLVKKYKPHMVGTTELANKAEAKMLPLFDDLLEDQGMLRSPGGSDGRYLYYETRVAKLIKSGKIELPTAMLLDGDTKQAAWGLFEFPFLEGKKIGFIAGHTENQDGVDKKTKKNANDLRVTQTKEFGKRGRANIKAAGGDEDLVLYVADTNSEKMAAAAMKADGWTLLGPGYYTRWDDSAKKTFDWGFILEGTAKVQRINHAFSDHTALMITWTITY